MLARSPTDPRAEEFAIHDYEHFGPYQVGEYDSLGWISRVATGITEHGLALAAWAEHCDRDPEQLATFEDAYRGEWSSLTAYAEELLDDLGISRELEEAIPELLQGYVHLDTQAFARDLIAMHDLTIVEHDRGVWVFEGTG
jgi:antirestriction protein